ncbi:MAG TPA: hypothetical protein VMU12_02855 [Candidatus Paceibacterota bacterium]|nr:hypothetical protein [Candidatus Paceibacterota bacterium]
MPFSLSDFATAASSDVAKIVADLPDSVWDKVYRAAVERGIIAETQGGRLVQAGALIAAGCALEQQFGTGGLSGFLRQVISKSHGDLAKRIIINGGTPATAIRKKE